jgi:Resolvase, N terminal domain
MDYVKFIYRPLVARAAHHVLVGRNRAPQSADRGRFNRRELLKLLKNIIPGDVVTVTRIDRLARSTFDLFAIVKRIVDAKEGDACVRGGVLAGHIVGKIRGK